MNDRIHAGLAVPSACFVGAAFAVRWAVTPVREPGRHRAVDRLPSEEVLCGPPSTYTDPWADTQVFGVVKTGFGRCEACDDTTAGVVTRNGFRCGEFYRHPGGGS